MMNKPAAFIMVEGGRTWFRTSAETEEAIRTGFIMETVPLYTAPPKQEPLTSKLISLGNNCHESFIKGVRFAEKMHGIGGGE
jgi:hypothetical protein